MGLFSFGRSNKSKTKRVLVVEDSRTQAAQLAFLLKSAQYEVDMATSAEVALEKLAAGNTGKKNAPAYDVVLSDIVMPNMTGYDLCRRIKESENTQGIAVVLLTALNDPMDVIHGIKCGADNFITKPYNKESLLERLDTIFQRRNLIKSNGASWEAEFRLMGEKIQLTADKQQIFNLLFTSFEYYLKNSKRTEQRLRENEQTAQTATTKLAQFEKLVRQVKSELNQATHSSSFTFKSVIRNLENYSEWLNDDLATSENTLVQKSLKGLIDETAKLQVMAEKLEKQLGNIVESVDVKEGGSTTSASNPTSNAVGV
ncbi:MAG: hypothetical protein CMJ78_12700 [Planctomycetaceae bacterium]|nr:hypothetical protein [Planctomycetaceae bacterium]